MIALVIPTVVVIFVGAESVQRVSDVGTIPSGLPLPSLPNLSMLSPGVITGALAVLGHHVGDSRLIGGRPPSAVCRRRVL